MTFPFQTDNIFYLPPGKPFRVYDLLGWRCIEFHVQATRLLLESSSLLSVQKRARQALDKAQTNGEPIDGPALDDRMQGFLQTLPLAVSPSRSTREFETAFAPLIPTFWARFSQEPMESFFHEDYEETECPAEGQSSVILSCVGAVSFNTLGEAECELTSDEPFSLHLSTEAGAPTTRVFPLDPFEPLPLLREYCGYKGSSNQGEMVTIDLHGQIPDECLASIPIRRTGSHCYETLYLHLSLPTDRQTTRPFRRGDSDALAHNLVAMGFEPRRRTRRFSAWSRGGDVVQVYRDLPGKESERVLRLPSFCLAAQAEGSSNPGARSALLGEIFGDGG